MLDANGQVDAEEMARTRAGVRGLAMLNTQADTLRAHLEKLRERLVEAQLEFDASQTALVVEANQQLVLAALRADAIAEAARSNFDHLANASQRDALTGLPNRALMFERMQATIARAGRRRLSFAVLFIDLENFRQVSATVGHAAADELLRSIARRLETSVRETDTVSRHGRHEFVVLLAELSPVADTNAVAAKLLQELQAPVALDGQPVQVAASIGISLFPVDGHDANALIALADARGKRLAASAEDVPTGRSVPDLDRPMPLRPEHVAFLAMVAHELRNPLAPLRHAATLLSRAGTKGVGLEKLQGIIVRQVSRMARLIDDLLHVSSEGVGKFRLEYEDVDLADLFVTVVEACHPAIEGRSQQLELQLPDAWPRMRGDAVRLAQVFGNLIDNASRYTPDGGKLSLVATLKRDELEVVISDTGVGISAEALQHIFKLFVQENRVPAAREGLGIGLAVVRELVQLHGGSVIARSKGHNRGSSFVVRLPLLQAAPTDAA